MLRRLAALLALLAPMLVVAPAQAAPAGLTYVRYFPGEIQNPVEQYTDWPFPEDQSLWYLNPTRCAWDVDDHWQDLALPGTLAAGATLSIDECMIASQSSFYRTVNGYTAWWASAPGHLGVEVRAPSPELVVRSCYSPQGRCFTADPTPDGRTWIYRLCTGTSYRPGDPALAVIPGSNGAPGLRQTITVTVTNPTGRQVKSVASDVQAVGVAQGGGAGCVSSSGLTTDYPFSFSTA